MIKYREFNYNWIKKSGGFFSSREWHYKNTDELYKDVASFLSKIGDKFVSTVSSLPWENMAGNRFGGVVVFYKGDEE